MTRPIVHITWRKDRQHPLTGFYIADPETQEYRSIHDKTTVLRPWMLKIGDVRPLTNAEYNYIHNVMPKEVIA